VQGQYSQPEVIAYEFFGAGGKGSPFSRSLLSPRSGFTDEERAERIERVRRLSLSLSIFHHAFTSLPARFGDSPIRAGSMTLLISS
jgi:hypothetical protein